VPAAPKPVSLSTQQARRIWLAAQALNPRRDWGDGSAAAHAIVAHLGYVQIDTIHVIERCHHHILWSRAPAYRRDDLHTAQSVDRSVFEYWTHALSYVAAEDIRFFLPAMKQHRETPRTWFGEVTPSDLRKVIRRIREDGALTIRDIDDDVLVDKHHPWASRKPSKRALQRAFYDGLLTISARDGMLKTYELTERHFGWERAPRPASERQLNEYLLERALRSQGIISLDSACYLDAKRKPALRELIEARIRRGTLVPVAIEGHARSEHWAAPETLEEAHGFDPALVHILSPFDPLVIQRKRLGLFFGYEHRFEAYVPKEKRVLGYFALPVLVGDEIVAAIDAKADRAAGRLQINQWTWVGEGDPARHKAAIEAELERFERFQLRAPPEALDSEEAA
jgi:uncharacterized protein YcaQ